MGFTKIEKFKQWFRSVVKIPRGVVIVICVLPAALTASFYILRPYPDVMNWVSLYISGPVRSFLGFLSSIYPFSMMEVLCTAAGIFLIYYLIKSIRGIARRRGKWKLLGKSLLPLFIVGLYIFSLFSWLWNSGYHAPGFAEKHGFSGGGIAVEDLIAVTAMFAEKANELALLVERDEDGYYIGNRRAMFATSTGIYRNMTEEFPGLDGRIFAPKSMLYSWLMSISGYTGMYFALTGEAMINTRPPMVFMPATVAHEHAHQLGIYAEDEASFVGILACVKSGDPVFQYAGYMSGLNYLLNALGSASALSSFQGYNSAWWDIYNSLSDEVSFDRQETFTFWASQKTVDTGIDLIDTVLTAVVEYTSDTVDTIYDSYLRSQNQELGIRSYGACVDLLVEYFK